MMYLKSIKLSIIVFTLICLSVTFAYATPLSSKITAGSQRSLDLSFEGAWINFKLTNESSHPLYLLRYEIPVEGFENDLFEITCEGQKMNYMGRLVLRKGPLAQDWILLAPGESLTAELDLSKIYDLNRRGTYKVRFRSMMHAIEADSIKDLPVVDMDDVDDMGDDPVSFATLPQMIQSNEINWVINQINPNQNRFDVPAMDSRAFCSSGQSSTLDGDQNTASSQAYNSSARVGNNNWYITWFGAYNSSRASTVRGNYSAMGSALGSGINYDCSGAGECKPTWWAYVYPSNPYNIWICNGYWNEGGSIRASILLHEASHWNVVAGTADHGYGYQNCRNFADNDPYTAITNADNYRYGALY